MSGIVPQHTIVLVYYVLPLVIHLSVSYSNKIWVKFEFWNFLKTWSIYSRLVSVFFFFLLTYKKNIQVVWIDWFRNAKELWECQISDILICWNFDHLASTEVLPEFAYHHLRVWKLEFLNRSILKFFWNPDQELCPLTLKLFSITTIWQRICSTLTCFCYMWNFDIATLYFDDVICVTEP